MTETKHFLTTVTVTGADDTVDPAALLPLQARYPHAEFGILLSQGRVGSEAGCNRFPGSKWLRQLAAVAAGGKLRLSGHLCGNWVRTALAGAWPADAVEAAAPGLAATVKRWQLNTHSQPHNVCPRALDGVLRVLAADGVEVIFQLDGLAGPVAADHYLKLGHKNISGLFDLSAGAGRLPDQWPTPVPGLRCGYAGGLSPENAAEQAELVQRVALQGSWVDAETKLRSDKDDSFDLGRVEAFLAAWEPWVAK
jgi:hypothetical protein